MVVATPESVIGTSQTHLARVALYEHVPYAAVEPAPRSTEVHVVPPTTFVSAAKI